MARSTSGIGEILNQNPFTDTNARNSPVLFCLQHPERLRARLELCPQQFEPVRLNRVRFDLSAIHLSYVDTATVPLLFLIPPHNHGINPSAPTQAGAHVENAENA